APSSSPRQAEPCPTSTANPGRSSRIRSSSAPTPASTKSCSTLLGPPPASRSEPLLLLPLLPPHSPSTASRALGLPAKDAGPLARRRAWVTVGSFESSPTRARGNRQARRRRGESREDVDGKAQHQWPAP